MDPNCVNPLILNQILLLSAFKYKGEFLDICIARTPITLAF